MNNPHRTIPRLLVLFIAALAPLITSAQPDRRIESLIEAGNFEEARPLIEKRLEQIPHDGYALYNLALIHYAGGNYDEAVVLWEKVRLSRDEDLVTKAIAQIGNASYRISEKTRAEGRQEDATIQLRRAQHSLGAAVERDDDYDVAVKNYEFVSEELVKHLIQQGNSKIEKSETKWVKGERDLVLFRSALTDYEEALSIKPEDEEIQKLVQETRERMKDYLTESGEQNLKTAEKTLEKLKEPTKEDRLNREDARDLQVAQDAIREAVANFEDAASISPDKETEKKAEDARKKASELMQEIAEKWQKNSEAYQEEIASKQQRRDQIQEQLESEKDDKKRSQLSNESRDLARENQRNEVQAMDQQQRAVDHYQEAVDLDPQNQAAQAALDELRQKMSEELEAKADENIAVADQAQENIDNRQERLDQMREDLAQTEPGSKQNRLESDIEKYENANASSSQHQADQLISAKENLEKATQLDPNNESAQKKLEETQARLPEILEQAADLQLASAQSMQQEGKQDQAIARMEQAIKNLDSAQALSTDEAQQQQLNQKMEAARQELLAERNDLAAAMAQQMKQQAQQQAQQQMMAQQQQNQQQGQPPEQAMEYQEMVQFTEAAGSEQFGNFDTTAMKKTVKDW